MSTELGIVSGRKEFPDTERRKSDYKPATLQLTRFYGGVRNGPMLQLSTGITQDAHIQLNSKQIEELKRILELF